MKRKLDLSVIVPCYNEVKNIPLLVKRFLEILPKNIRAELILVDNGSVDTSKKVISDYAKRYSFIEGVYIKKNIGYGNGIWGGLKKGSGDYLCWTHADMQTDIADTIQAYRIIVRQRNPKRCFVKGNRRKRLFVDWFFMCGMSVFETFALRKVLYDINAQPNLFHRSFLEGIVDPPKDFSFDIYFYYIAKKLRYKVIRFPVLFPKRIHGESHWSATLKGKWRFIKRTFIFTFKLRKVIKNAYNNP